MRKRFFRLCHGPLDGRTISPGTPDYLRATRAGDGRQAVFAMPDRADESAAGPSAPTGAEAVHLYEPFDRIDEIWFDIVLCKYVGTRSPEPGLN